MSSSAKPDATARVAFTGPAPSPAEAAAAVAAIERFMSETTTVAAAPAAAISAWHRAALVEGVSARHRAIPPDPGAGFPVSG